MRTYLGLIGLAWLFQASAPAPQAVVRELAHESQVLGGNRTYQVVLPPDYDTSKKRYPVIYWFHGYEQTNPERDAETASYVAAHDVIVVHTGPVDTEGQFPLYFPELVDQVDKTLRTIADRDHRALTGFGLGGFMAFWMAGKYPDLVSSASSFNGTPEASVGPRNLDVTYRLDDQFANFEGVRTRLVTGTPDPSAFYHLRMNQVWQYTGTSYTTESFDVAHAAEAIPNTFDFHLKAFATPLPKPAAFTHADVYPNFDVWGWEVVSDRKQPGFTMLENVSNKGFRSTVREWAPAGRVIPEVKLSITSAPRMYAAGSSHTVTYIRLRDGNVRRATQKADAQGRLTFDLDGEPQEVGVSAEAVLAIGGYELAEGAWATAGKPVKLRVKFWNKGAAPSAPASIQWESPNPGVSLEFSTSRLYALKPGQSAVVALTFTVADETRTIARIVASIGPASHTGLEVPLFPPAEPTLDFHIADGRSYKVYQHATQITDVTFGEGNSDEHAAPGESFAILLPDGDGYRAAELFTNDACVDNSARGDDSWNDYDHGGSSVRYSLPAIRPECPPGHVVHMLARVWIPHAPDHQLRYAALEFPVWYRPGEEPK